MAGKYYYTEIYFINKASAGWYDLEAQVPNSNDKVQQRITAIQKVAITVPSTPEIVTFGVFGGDMQGEYELYALEVDPKTLKTTYNVSTSVKADATAD